MGLDHISLSKGKCLETQEPEVVTPAPTPAPKPTKPQPKRKLSVFIDNFTVAHVKEYWKKCTSTEYVRVFERSKCAIYLLYMSVGNNPF